MSLRSKLVVRLSLVLIIGAALLFIPAGSWKFWQGWIFMAVAFIPSILAFLYFYKHDPQLIERRLQSKEKVSEQKLLMRVSKPVFLAAFLLPGLDYRWDWTRTFLGAVPLWLVLLCQALILGALLLGGWVMKVNSFASRTIQVEAGQKVISTGPYRMVRHPLYSGSLVMWLATPLALGSYIAWPAFALLIPFYVLRLLNEEKILRQELPGYPEYCQHTRFRLVPFDW
ncbi:MAG: isoprenylcysteine carboxylmethyltransferase family protein [Candidatus Acidiferrum sp.]|jgi:protein-S-isoprenylcysteine O-methyltransferase Ste14